MLFFHYFLKNLNTNEQIHIIENIFLGDIGEKIIYKGISYIVENWIDEYEDFSEPEDFDLEVAYVSHCGGYYA